MHTLSRFYASGTLFLLVFLCGCMGAGSPTPPARALSIARSSSAESALSLARSPTSDAQTAKILGSNSNGQTVNVYSTDGKIIATIGNFLTPTGLSIDAAGNVYIAELGGNGVRVYRNDYKTLIATLVDDNGEAFGVAIDPKSGLVAVTNQESSTGGRGQILFYPKGATSPCKYVLSPLFSGYFFGAFDSFGSFYFVGKGGVGVLSGGCSAKKIQRLTTANSISAQSVQITPAGKIAVLSVAAGQSAIYTYDPPSNGMLGSPVATTPLGNSSFPSSFAFDKSGTLLWAADTKLGELLEYSYPTGNRNPKK